MGGGRVLVFRSGFLPEMRVIAPSDYREGADGKKRAEIQVSLVAAPRR